MTAIPDRASPVVRESKTFRLILLVFWLAAVAWLVAHHTMWRDEVKALTLNVESNTVFTMLHRLGDGSPAFWHLLLRVAYGIAPTPLVLPILAGLVGISAAILLLARAPLSVPWLAVILFGQFFVYEYTVMARHYGLSMLILFGLAALWQRGYRGIGLGLLLLLLANCNVHSVALSGAFLLYWLLEEWEASGARWTRGWREWLKSSTLAAIGVILCLATVYPPIDDASHATPGPLVPDIIIALFFPAIPLNALFPSELVTSSHAVLGLIFCSPMLFVCLLAFCRRPSLFASALAAMLLLSLMFTFIFPGSYRHSALLLAFWAMLLWLDRASPLPTVRRGRLASFIVRAQPIGTAFLFMLFALQILGTAKVFANIYYSIPESRSADFASFVHHHPEFASSWIIADPDYLIEPVPYYLSNPVWRIREQQPGAFVNFTTHARLDITLGDVLATASMLRARSGKPVIILLGARLDQVRNKKIHESIDWTLDIKPNLADRFLKATARVARYGPATSGETFDVYVLP
jgi:hypothetical protein